jgi:DNA-binding SARP family transcriptional activator
VVTALARGRLSSALERVWDLRFGLVVAPAGWGKTTALAHFAAGLAGPVAWFRSDRARAGEQAALSHLEQTLGAVLGVAGGWTSADAALDALHRAEPQPQGERALLIVDDLHLLEGTAGEALLERLVEHGPDHVRVLAASRGHPRFNLPRLRVSGDLLEVSADDLRFRSWEVERLFREFYQEPLPPEDLARLARRTEGWAAGLALFHLATQGKPVEERRRHVAALGSRSRLVRDYLARNVLEGLPGHLTDFLVETCVLGRLTPELCDALLGGRGSIKLLEEVEERQIFVHALDDEGSWRYHEVLRAHLETALVERVGEPAARQRYLRAGELLEAAGHLPEALAAYCRAEDFGAAVRLLGGRGEQLLAGATDWMDLLPRSLLDHDPWLMLATARHHLGRGRLAEALAGYRKAEDAFGDALPAARCRAERRRVAAWAEPDAQPGGDWTGLIRAATQRDPLGAHRQAAHLPGPTGPMAAAVCAAVGGWWLHAETQLELAAAHPEADELLLLGVRLLRAAAELMNGAIHPPRQVEQAAIDAETLGAPWLARVARSLLALSSRDDGAAEADAVVRACLHDGDAWGAAIATLVRGIGELWSGRAPVERLDEARRRFAALGAGTIEAQAASLTALAMAQRGDDGAMEAALAAERQGRALASAAAQGCALLALTVLTAGAATEGESDAAADYRARLAGLAAECGLPWSSLVLRVPQLEPGAAEQAATAAEPAPAPGPGPEAPATLQVRCLGAFELRVGGRALDVAGLKPRVATLLHVLVMHRGRPVHRDVLIAALWPEADEQTGRRNLQVAVSALRRAVAPVALAREGERYGLQLPEGTGFDLLAFDRGLAAGREAQAQGDAAAAIEGFGAAVAAYRGELLPGAGAAEWVVAERERLKGEAAEAAATLAELLLAAGRPDEAAAACERGLHADRYRDVLWRLLASAHRQAGALAAAAKAEAGYAAMLAELGLAAGDEAAS